MDRVESLSLGAREPQPLLRDDAQARRLQMRVDLARQVSPRGVGLDDGEGALGRHGLSLASEGTAFIKSAPGSRKRRKAPHSCKRDSAARLAETGAPCCESPALAIALKDACCSSGRRRRFRPTIRWAWSAATAAASR